MRYDLSTANDPRTDIRIKANTKQKLPKVKTPISDHTPPLPRWGVCVFLRMIYRAFEVEARHYRSSVTHSLYRISVSFRQDGDPIKKAVVGGEGKVFGGGPPTRCSHLPGDSAFVFRSPARNTLSSYHFTFPSSKPDFLRLMVTSLHCINIRTLIRQQLFMNLNCKSKTYLQEKTRKL